MSDPFIAYSIGFLAGMIAMALAMAINLFWKVEKKKGGKAENEQNKV